MPIDKVRVMISSRCNDYPVAGGGSFPLKALRKTLKVQVDAAGLFKHGMLQCFTNEHEPAKAASSSAFHQYSYVSGNPEVELVPTEDDG